MPQFNLANPIDVRSTCSNIDYLYGPYESITAALLAVPINRRALGRTVAVIEDGTITEYWWKSGLSDSNLEQKSNSTPTLQYTEDFPEGTVLKANSGEPLYVKVKFTSSAYGQCTITIYKDGTVFKTVKADKGIITLDLGVASSDGTYNYTITAVDALTIPAENELTFKAIIGGASLNSDFQDLIDTGINTSSDINITYNASVADTSKTIKFLARLIDGEGSIVNEWENIGSGDTPNILLSQNLEVGVIDTAGSYTLNMYAYTGETPDDTSGDNVSTSLSYKFQLMNAGDFAIASDVTEISSNTNTTITIPFRIYSGSNLILQAHGVVYDSHGEVVGDISLDRSVASNTLSYWSLGKVQTEGSYMIEMWATTTGGERSESDVVLHIPMVIEQYIPTYSIVTNGLMAQFLADGKSNKNDRDTAGYWRNSLQGSSLYFSLKDLNYNTNGWKHVDESIDDTVPEGEMMLKFTGDSYGRLKTMSGSAPADTDSDYNPMAILSSSANTGFTCEIIFRTRCIGELQSKVMTGHTGSGTATAGFSAGYNKVTIGSNGVTLPLDVAENEWIHATMVIDRTVHTNVEDQQDYAPRKLMTIYINGSACGSTIIDDNWLFTNYGPVILNAAINTSSGNIVDYFGASEIKTIRFYNRPLLSSEVVQNYIASIYDRDEQARIAGRNGDVLPVVRFIRNGDNPTTFEQLNQVTQKSMQKLVYVYSRVLYEPVEGETIEWTNVDVKTQGTSSLLFPVKNYKITLYTDNTYTTKLKTDAFEDLGWQKESKFTLKCDYMEAAHLNNTPSCSFYNDMIDALVESGEITTGWDENHEVYTASDDQRSPSRRDKMFDAIKGFPCVLYYYESEEDYNLGNGTYVGTYMFNIDKSGKSLGFDAPATLDEDGETVIDVTNPRADISLYDSFDPTRAYSKGDRVKYDGVAYQAKVNMLAGAWNASNWKVIPAELENICQSFEGVANGSDTAGCFYSYEDWKTSHYAEYCAAAYTHYLEEYTGEDPLPLNEFIQYYSINHPDEKYRSGEPIEGFFDDGGYLYTKEAFITAEGKFEDEYDYFASDFEARYDWDDYEEGGAEFWGDSTWGIKRMIDWVSSASATAGTQNDTFKSEFGNYFNFKYCALYYLQMIVFGQVDNAGKNSMWDTWDGIHWMPRPYDLDTMAGLNNTGYESINPDAELIRALSPYQLYNATSGTAAYAPNVAVDADSRYESYNTRTSKFWIAFATSFKSELADMYATLRNADVYSIDYIMDYFKSKTSDIIGEAYYNRDMTTKFYKLADIESFIDRMHGNRVQRFKAWMSARIEFCDSLFGYTSPTKSTNNIVSMRADAYTDTVVSVNLGIKVYTPQYIRIEVGSGRDAIVESYCSPDARYIDPITGDTVEGTLFTLPLPGGNKEVSISGAGNIKQFVNLNGMKASSLVLTYAGKLTNLDLSYSTKLTALSLSHNYYLQTLNCTGASKLGTDASGAQLDLSNCVNLKQVILDNTKLTSVIFPVGGSIKTISLANTTVTALALDSLHFLTNVNVNNCPNILSYSIANCPKIASLVADDLPLTTVNITNCEALESISLKSDTRISSLTVSLCPSITHLYLNNNRSSAIQTLDLTTLFGLEYLNITGAIVETIKFPLHISATSDTPWGEDFKNLLVNNSELKFIQYGETPSSGVDMSQLTGLSSLSFNNCNKIERIFGLNYTGSCASLFSSCISLQSVAGSIKCNGSAASIFYRCSSLSNLAGLSIDFANCTTLSNAFAYNANLGFSTIKRFLDSCGNALVSVASLCYNKDFNVKTNTTDTRSDADFTTLPARFFGNCKNVTDISSAFYDTAQLKSISASAFLDNNGNTGLPACTSASYAFDSTRITSIPTHLMALLPSLKSAVRMFGYNASLTSGVDASFFWLYDDNSSTYTKPSNLTDIESMFVNCTNLNINLSTMTDTNNICTPLTKVTNAKCAFRNCQHLIGAVPAGIFSTMTACVSLNGFFALTGITDLPNGGSIFMTSEMLETYKNVNTSPSEKLALKNRMTALTSISGLFARTLAASTATIIVSSHLFAGGGNIRNAGADRDRVTGGTASSYYTDMNGIFENCTKILQYGDSILSEMPNLRDCEGMFKGCTHLLSSAGNTYNTLFSENIYLQNVSNFFNGCTQFAVSSIPALFENCKQTLTNASFMFYGTQIGTFDSLMFKDCEALTNVASIFENCTLLEKTLTGIDLFDGCISLANVSSMFKNTIVKGSVYRGLFDDCRSTLVNTSGMFYNCQELDGEIGTGDENVGGTDYGLLANCINLTDTSFMFFNCSKLTGRFPYDIFYTTSDEIKYTKLTDISSMFYNCGFNTPTEYDDVDYMFHPDMLSKLIAVTYMQRTFAYITKMSSAPVHPTSFNGQYLLTSIRELFRRATSLTGAISNYWFHNCLGTLRDCYGAFSHTRLSSVDNNFLRPDSSTANNKLAYVSRMFYGCSLITSNLPQCNNTAAFSKIDYSTSDGNLAYCYNAANAANYSTFGSPWNDYVSY